MTSVPWGGGIEQDRLKLKLSECPLVLPSSHHLARHTRFHLSGKVPDLPLHQPPHILLLPPYPPSGASETWGPTGILDKSWITSHLSSVPLTS